MQFDESNISSESLELAHTEPVLTADKDHTPTQHKWVTDEHGNQRKVEVAKRVKRWCTASVDGKINLVVRYGSKLVSDG